MKTTINNQEYEIKAVRTYTCSAGTAYWRLMLCLPDEDGAIYSQSTGAIYGEPDLIRFESAAKAVIAARQNPPEIKSETLWQAIGVSIYGDLLAYGDTKEDAVAYLAVLTGCTHYDTDTKSNQAAYLYHKNLGKLCVTKLIMSNAKSV